MDNDELRQIIIADDPYGKTSKDELEKANKWINEALKKRLNSDASQTQALDIPVIMKCKFVKSKYSSAWSGVVIDKKNRTGMNPLYLILVLKDKNGNTPRKRIIKTLDSAWTIEIDKFDISYINQDWFKGLPVF
jgi:hypothetical protein